METVSLSSAARNIIIGFKNSDDNSSVLENWKSMISALNQYISYADIPYISEVPLAMYMYVMKYSSKRSEENSIRAITTFGVLMNAVEHTEGKERMDYLALVASLLTYYKKRFNDVSNYSIFPITIPQTKEYFNQTVIDYGNTEAYYDSMLLYVYSHINIDSQSFWDNDEIRSKFISNKETFLDEYNQKQHEVVLDGDRVMRDCYNRMNQVGKCPIFVPSETNSEIYNKTYGLVPHCLSFNAYKFFFHETSGTMSEGELLNAQIKLDIREGLFSIICEGLNEQYLRNEIFLPIRDLFVRKVDQHIELNFNTSQAYRDNNHKYGNVDNVPTSMDLHFEHFKLTQIVLTFIVGEQGWMRTLHLYGN